MSFVFPKPYFVRSEKYKAWIRLQRCIICGKNGSEAAHIGVGGTGIKTDDLRCLPLCFTHHNGGNTSIHHLGPERFSQLFNIDLAEQIIRHIIRFFQEELLFGDNSVK